MSTKYNELLNTYISLQRILKEILETPATTDLDPFDSQSLTILQNHYRACLDENAMDHLGIAPLLDVVKVVKQLFNGSTSIEPHFAEWAQIIQDVESEVGDDNEQQPFGFPQVILHGKETEEDRDKRREKEHKKNKKQGRKEREKKEKEERKERKRKQKEEKKKQKVDDKKKKKEQKQLLKEAERAKRVGLTAALAFMHSRGIPKHFLESSFVLTKHRRYSRIIPVRHRWGHWKRSQRLNTLVPSTRPRPSC